jgi:hypothetical protein
MFAKDTQFGPNVVVVITNVKAQQTILDNIRNKNQGNNSENILNKGKRAIKLDCPPNHFSPYNPM